MASQYTNLFKINFNKIAKGNTRLGIAFFLMPLSAPLASQSKNLH